MTDVLTKLAMFRLQIKESDITAKPKNIIALRYDKKSFTDQELQQKIQKVQDIEAKQINKYNNRINIEKENIINLKNVTEAEFLLFNDEFLMPYVINQKALNSSQYQSSKQNNQITSPQHLSTSTNSIKEKSNLAYTKDSQITETNEQIYQSMRNKTSKLFENNKINSQKIIDSKMIEDQLLDGEHSYIQQLKQTIAINDNKNDIIKKDSQFKIQNQQLNSQRVVYQLEQLELEQEIKRQERAKREKRAKQMQTQTKQNFENKMNQFKQKLSKQQEESKLRSQSHIMKRTQSVKETITARFETIQKNNEQIIDSEQRYQDEINQTIKHQHDQTSICYQQKLAAAEMQSKLSDQKHEKAKQNIQKQLQQKEQQQLEKQKYDLMYQQQINEKVKDKNVNKYFKEQDKNQYLTKIEKTKSRYKVIRDKCSKQQDQYNKESKQIIRQSLTVGLTDDEHKRLNMQIQQNKKEQQQNMNKQQQRQLLIQHKWEEERKKVENAKQLHLMREEAKRLSQAVKNQRLEQLLQQREDRLIHTRNVANTLMSYTTIQEKKKILQQLGK